jgi:transcriptional regulator with XRE-family HTH domain
MTKQREARGLSQEAVAQQMELDQPSISKLERGSRGVSVIEFVAWSRAIGLSWDELADGLRDIWSEQAPLADSLWRGPTRKDW